MKTKASRCLFPAVDVIHSLAAWLTCPGVSGHETRQGDQGTAGIITTKVCRGLRTDSTGTHGMQPAHTSREYLQQSIYVVSFPLHTRVSHNHILKSVYFSYP